MEDKPCHTVCLEKKDPCPDLPVPELFPVRLTTDTPVAAPPVRGDYQVLVVDDDPANLDVVTRFLNLENISTRAVANGWAALETIAADGAPGLVLLDIMMPGISGYTVCENLRKIYPASKLPIIMLTGRREVDDLVRAYRAGANDYIAKPFTREELMARVSSGLSLQQAYQAVQENLRLEMEIREQQRKNRASQMAAERESLEKLRYQINPHFLFNALAAIRGAVYSDPGAAHAMISHLADFSRLSLSLGASETLSIDREISVIRHYLAMKQMRYGDYMKVSIQIEPGIGNRIIPAFLLQPLVENAVKYGARTSPDFLKVDILARAQPPDRIYLAVSNTGTWHAGPGEKGRPCSGIGLHNIRSRLNRLYKDCYLFERQIAPGRVSMVILLPEAP